MQKAFDLTTKILVILVIPFWFLIGSVRMLVTSEYLRIEYNKTAFPEDPLGFSEEQRISFATENVRYLRENLPISALENQNNEGQALYNLRELSHMEDVQDVYQFFWNVWKTISLIMVLVAILSLTWRGNWQAFASALKIGGFGTAIFIAIIGILAFIGWDTWFLIFHKLFFTDGTWTFNFSDTLIRLFPQKFWVDAVFTVSGLSLILGLLTGFIGQRLAKGTSSPLNR